MKKSVSVLLGVLLLFSFVLTGCGGGDKGPKSALEGTTWKLTTAEASGIEVSAADMGMDDFTIEFKANGDATASVAGESSDGSYEDNGEEVTLKMDGETLTLKLEENKMSMEQDGATLIFEKQ